MLNITIKHNEFEVSTDGTFMKEQIPFGGLLTIFFNDRPSRKFRFARDNRVAMFTNVEAFELERDDREIIR